MRFISRWFYLDEDGDPCSGETEIHSTPGTDATIIELQSIQLAIAKWPMNKSQLRDEYQELIRKEAMLKAQLATNTGLPIHLIGVIVEHASIT